MILGLWLACGGEKGTDSAACESNVTWDSFGRGFLTENCQTCHASTSPDRNGAPQNVVFDTEADAMAQAGSILALATGETPRMPPAGGVTDADRATLAEWLSCAR